MKVYLVSFATPNFYNSQKKLNKSALQFGVDECIPFTNVDLKKTEFYQKNKVILDHERGAGYWLWKPFIILEAMKQADEGDIVIYSDSGAEVIESLQPLIDICLKQQGLLFFQVPSFTGKHTNIKWTKRDCLLLMDADYAEIHHAEQVAGSPHFYQKNTKHIEFIEEWLFYCEDPRILTDQPNTCGFRNYPDFLDHRHDQSVLSILARKKQIEIFRDPSQFGNHLKLEQFRKKGELPAGVQYSQTPCRNSPYGTLFDLHRKRTTPLTSKISHVLKWVAETQIKKHLPEAVDLAVSISIGITTFAHRFENYFMPLLKRIREYDRDVEIVVAVNGEHEQTFNETYRKNILQFLADHEKTYPIFFPRFRGVAKLWNTLAIHATHDHILILNDDIDITDKKFLQHLIENIKKNNGKSFIINNSWSHFLLSREEIDYLGYFDERLLGIGEEDGDITWRYYQEFRQPIANYKMKYFKNFADETVHSYKPLNIKCHSGTKYSLFNRNLIRRKYQPDSAGFRGMFDQPVRLAEHGPNQYPNERFYRENKNKL